MLAIKISVPVYFLLDKIPDPRSLSVMLGKCPCYKLPSCFIFLLSGKRLAFLRIELKARDFIAVLLETPCIILHSDAVISRLQIAITNFFFIGIFIQNTKRFADFKASVYECRRYRQHSAGDLKSRNYCNH